MPQRKDAKLKQATVRVVLGTILLCIFGLLTLIYIITIMSGDHSDDTIGAFFVFTVISFASLMMITSGNKVQKKYKRFLIYNDMIINQNITGFESIAAALRVAPVTVTAEVQEMVRLGYFVPGAYVNLNTHSIVFPSAEQTPKYTYVNPAATGTSAPVMKTVVCPGCGAKVTLPTGSAAVCEYCGSSVSAQ